MLVPAMWVGRRPISSRASRMGTWAKPLAPPPPNARPMFTMGSGPGGDQAVHGGSADRFSWSGRVVPCALQAEGAGLIARRPPSEKAPTGGCKSVFIVYFTSPSGLQDGGGYFSWMALRAGGENFAGLRGKWRLTTSLAGESPRANGNTSKDDYNCPRHPSGPGTR